MRRELADPEAFLAALRGKTVVLDEIHRPGDPARLLKIAASDFADIKVLATGSSTLGASPASIAAPRQARTCTS